MGVIAKIILFFKWLPSSSHTLLPPLKQLTTKMQSDTDTLDNQLLYINFNQDFSCLSVGSRRGYRIYNCDPFGKCYGKSEGGIGIVEMLFCTSLVALVGAGEQPAFSPRRLQIINTKRQSTICELTFVSAILAVKLNRKRLVVTLEEHIYIYDIGNMKLLNTIDTSPNPNALCALSPSSENCYLAYPSNTSGTAGELLLFDAIHLQAVNIIQAHKSPLSCVSFNFDGTMVATSSDKGTVIRVFSVPSGQKLYQFRRGTYPARIYSISFNLTGSMLSVSSDTDTLHIFKLLTPEEKAVVSVEKKANSEKRFSVLESIKSPLVSATTAVGSYLLPSSVTEIWEPQRDYAFAKIPKSSLSQSATSASAPTSPTGPTASSVSSKTHLPTTVCALTENNQLMVVTGDGFFYQYALPSDPNGGECTLQKQFSLLDQDES